MKRTEGEREGGREGGREEGRKGGRKDGTEENTVTSKSPLGAPSWGLSPGASSGQQWPSYLPCFWRCPRYMQHPYQSIEGRFTLFHGFVVKKMHFFFLFKNLSFFIYLCIIYFWLCWVFVAARGPSLVAVSGGHSLLWRTGLPSPQPLLLWSTGSRRSGFSSCGAWAQQLWLAGSRAQAQ